MQSSSQTQTSKRPYFWKVPEPKKRDYLSENIRRCRATSCDPNKKREPLKATFIPGVTRNPRYDHVPSRLAALLRPTQSSAPIDTSLRKSRSVGSVQSNKPNGNKLLNSFEGESDAQAQLDRITNETSSLKLKDSTIHNGCRYVVPAGDMPHHLGTMPKYLKQRQQEWKFEAEAKKEAEKNKDIPAGHILMPEHERIETLNTLQQNYDSLVAELNRIPIRMDTVRARDQKVKVESQCAKLEQAMKIFTRPRVYIKQTSTPPDCQKAPEPRRDYLSESIRRYRATSCDPSKKREPMKATFIPEVTKSPRYDHVTSRQAALPHPTQGSGPIETSLRKSRSVGPVKSNTHDENKLHNSFEGKSDAQLNRIRNEMSSLKLKESTIHNRGQNVGPAGDMPHHLGTLLEFLKQRKQEWKFEAEAKKEADEAKKVAEAKKEAEKNKDIPAGHILMPEHERIETLNTLQQNYDSLVAELNRIPIRMDTVRARDQKINVESQCAKLEQAMKIFSRPRVYIKEDNNSSMNRSHENGEIAITNAIKPSKLGIKSRSFEM